MKRVLVVDDEIAITEGLVALFELEQIEARGASDRSEAEALLAEDHYPVILADLRLVTEADGIQLLEWIREKCPGSRVASLTAFATPELEKKLLELGSTVVLRKPMPFEDIIAVVEEMLGEIDRQAAAQEARSGKPVDLVQLYSDVQRVLFAIPQRRYGMTADETEELVQEAWCLFLQKRHQITMPRPWLAGTIVNLTKQRIQKNTRHRASDLESLPESAEPSTDTSGGRDAVLAVRQGLARLDERSRNLIVLIGLEGRSYEDVARELNLPLGSVGPLYIRSKAKLKKVLSH